MKSHGDSFFFPPSPGGGGGCERNRVTPPLPDVISLPARPPPPPHRPTLHKCPGQPRPPRRSRHRTPRAGSRPTTPGGPGAAAPHAPAGGTAPGAAAPAPAAPARGERVPLRGRTAPPPLTRHPPRRQRWRRVPGAGPADVAPAAASGRRCAACERRSAGGTPPPLRQRDPPGVSRASGPPAPPPPAPLPPRRDYRRARDGPRDHLSAICPRSFLPSPCAPRPPPPRPIPARLARPPAPPPRLRPAALCPPGVVVCGAARALPGLGTAPEPAGASPGGAARAGQERGDPAWREPPPPCSRLRLRLRRDSEGGARRGQPRAAPPRWRSGPGGSRCTLRALGAAQPPRPGWSRARSEPWPGAGAGGRRWSGPAYTPLKVCGASCRAQEPLALTAALARTHSGCAVPGARIRSREETCAAEEARGTDTVRAEKLGLSHAPASTSSNIHPHALDLCTPLRL